MAYETISNVPLMQTSPEERALYMQLQANNKKKAKLANMLKQYRTNPGQFSADQRMFLEQQAMEAGLPMPDTQTNAMKVLGKGAASALDTAMFGLLPNELYTPLNQAERMATNVGGIAGLFAGGPAALGAGLFRGAAALPRFARAGLMKGMGQSGYRNLAQKGGLLNFLRGGKKGGNFMGGTARDKYIPKVSGEVVTPSMVKRANKMRPVEFKAIDKLMGGQKLNRLEQREVLKQLRAGKGEIFNALRFRGGGGPGSPAGLLAAARNAPRPQPGQMNLFA